MGALHSYDQRSKHGKKNKSGCDKWSGIWVLPPWLPIGLQKLETRDGHKLKKKHSWVIENDHQWMSLDWLYECYSSIQESSSTSGPKGRWPCVPTGYPSRSDHMIYQSSMKETFFMMLLGINAILSDDQKALKGLAESKTSKVKKSYL